MIATRRVLLPIVAVSCLMAPLAQPAAAENTLRIALSDRLAHAPWYIAERRGYFERNEVNVELIRVDPDDDLYDLFDVGDIDLAALTSYEILDYDAAGLELRGALLLGTSLAADALLATNDYTDVRQLRGRRVALERGSPGELLLQYALQRKGLSLDDLEVVNRSGPEALSALQSGDVDAAAGHAPYLPTDDEGSLRVLVDASISPGLVIDLIAGDPSMIERRRPEMKSLIEAWDDAVNYLRRNPEQAAAVMAEALAVPEADVLASIDGIELHTVDDNMQLLRGDFQQYFADMVDVLQRGGSTIASGRPSGNSILVLSPLRQLAAQR